MRFWDLIDSSDQETTDNSSIFDELSRTQRLYAFAICFVLGFFLSVLSTVKLTFGNLKGFAILYTVGNILSFVSTGFIVGFKKQLKSMFAPVRWVASLIVIGAMIATLVVAFVLKSGILSLIMCLIQFAAFLWYCASYIPYGRTIIRRIFGGLSEDMV
ncbi:hypothetical protein Glove_295g39 [Diversispora epigaea]|uniref:Protein transport protein SFT2 n=1 Tax=Diversispora epigaea TaxID=1348612 RepID=A0A397I3I3_9GLOM|nr:hypothetical protein Glove_295g39 [Diversispora epigaea]